MSTTVLEKDYKEPERPYSQKELNSTRKNNYRVLRLGKVRASHSKCGHFYLTKYNGRKEKEIKESGTCDTGNCSVCWKFSKTPRHLRNAADKLVTFYRDNFAQEPPYLTFDLLEGETDYYKWLYEEFI